MGSYDCKRFLNQLESWTEGERPADAGVHLRSCARCQSVVADLSTIEAEGRAWGGQEAEPPERLWTSLRAQLEKEGLIHASEADRREDAVAAEQGWFGGFFAHIPRPVLAGAYLSALIALCVALSGPLNKPTTEAQWLEGTEVATSPLSAQLNTFEQDPITSGRDLNPAVTASLHENLAVVDNYIALCKKSVQEEPQNEIARDYLYGAYQQKADLLAQLHERGENVQ